MITDFGFDFPHKQYMWIKESQLRSAFVDYFVRDLQHRRSAKINMNRAIMAYFDDPEELSFRACSKRY